MHLYSTSGNSEHCLETLMYLLEWVFWCYSPRWWLLSCLSMVTLEACVCVCVCVCVVMTAWSLRSVWKWVCGQTVLVHNWEVTQYTPLIHQCVFPYTLKMQSGSYSSYRVTKIAVRNILYLSKMVNN